MNSIKNKNNSISDIDIGNSNNIVYDNSSNNINDKYYWIKKFGLIKHIEGGYFKQVLESNKQLNKNNIKRSYFTSILYLLDSDSSSHLHRIKSDEVWYYSFGLSMVIHCILPNGQYERIVIGTGPNEYLQYNIAGGTIFCASPLKNTSNNNSNNNSNNKNKTINNKQISTEFIGNNDDNNNSYIDFSIVSCMVSPGFLYSEFELFTKNELIKIYPQHKELIEQFAFDTPPSNNNNNKPK